MPEYLQQWNRVCGYKSLKKKIKKKAYFNLCQNSVPLLVFITGKTPQAKCQNKQNKTKMLFKNLSSGAGFQLRWQQKTHKGTWLFVSLAWGTAHCSLERAYSDSWITLFFVVSAKEVLNLGISPDFPFVPVIFSFR